LYYGIKALISSGVTFSEMMSKERAYVNFAEKDLGTLEKGKFADMAVLSQDILAVDSEDIIYTDIIATVINGEVVYNKGI